MQQMRCTNSCNTYRPCGLDDTGTDLSSHNQDLGGPQLRPVACLHHHHVTPRCLRPRTRQSRTRLFLLNQPCTVYKALVDSVLFKDLAIARTVWLKRNQVFSATAARTSSQHRFTPSLLCRPTSHCPMNLSLIPRITVSVAVRSL